MKTACSKVLRHEDLCYHPTGPPSQWGYLGAKQDISHSMRTLLETKPAFEHGIECKETLVAKIHRALAWRMHGLEMTSARNGSVSNLLRTPGPSESLHL
jgi:hypothetical protein